jgi:hypothetical protein
LDDLLLLRSIDNVVEINGQRFYMRSGDDVLNALLNNRLRPQDSQKVVNEIFKNSTDPQLIDGLATWQASQPGFINAYRNSSEDQIVNAMTPLIGQSQARLVARKFLQGNVVPPPPLPLIYDLQGFPPPVSPQQWKTAYERLREMYALSPKALDYIDDGKQILNRIDESNPEAFRQSVLSNKLLIDQYLDNLRISKEGRKWFWNTIRDSKPTKMMIQITWGIVGFGTLAAIFAAMELSGISMVGSIMDIAFGPEARENLKKYACQRQWDWGCDNGGGGAPPDPGDIPDIK